MPITSPYCLLQLPQQKYHPRLSTSDGILKGKFFGSLIPCIYLPSVYLRTLCRKNYCMSYVWAGVQKAFSRDSILHLLKDESNLASFPCVSMGYSFYSHYLNSFRWACVSQDSLWQDPHKTCHAVKLGFQVFDLPLSSWVSQGKWLHLYEILFYL